MIFKDLDDIELKLNEPEERLLLALDLLESIEDFYVPKITHPSELEFHKNDTIGTVVGPLIFKERKTIDCSTQRGRGTFCFPIDFDSEQIQFKKCSADFVLVLEKGTQLSRLAESGFWRKKNCVLFCGCGLPPRKLRRFLRRLTDQFKLPLLAVFDCDPWGYFSYAALKSGSTNLAIADKSLALPECKFLGFTHRDVKRFKIPCVCGIRMTPTDKALAAHLSKLACFSSSAWQLEFNQMKKRGLKFEVDALNRHGRDFLAETYLPQKLAAGDRLE